MATIEQFINAVRAGNLGLVKNLLSEGGFNPEDEDNQALRCWAALKGDRQIVKCLLDIPAVREHASFQEIVANEPTVKTCWEDYLGCLALALADQSFEEGSYFSWLPNSVLEKTWSLVFPKEKGFWTTIAFKQFIEAAGKGHLDLLNNLLGEGGFDPAGNDNVALRTAASYGHCVIVERLLEIPAVQENVNSLKLALYVAVFSGRGEIAQSLLRILAVERDIDVFIHEIFTVAIMSDHREAVRCLLCIPAVRQRESFQNIVDIPIIKKCWKEHLNCVAFVREFRRGGTYPAWLYYDLLLKTLSCVLGEQADFFLKTVDEVFEQFIDAARAGNLSSLRALLREGSFNPGDYNNEALRLAAQNGHHEIVKCLLAIPAVRRHKSFQKIVAEMPIVKTCWEQHRNSALMPIKYVFSNEAFFANFSKTQVVRPSSWFFYDFLEKIGLYLLSAREKVDVFFNGAVKYLETKRPLTDNFEGQSNRSSNSNKGKEEALEVGEASKIEEDLEIENVDYLARTWQPCIDDAFRHQGDGGSGSSLSRGKEEVLEEELKMEEEPEMEDGDSSLTRKRKRGEENESTGSCSSSNVSKREAKRPR